jgi:hypothetical protein
VHALPAVPAHCVGAQLAASFTVVPGSAGAGNIVYRLRLTNASGRTCLLAGIPRLTLLAAKGTKLPTHTTGGTNTVTLPPHSSAAAEARFSPDVPGVGEPVTGRQCEPTATWLVVAGSRRVRIRPATPVCEHGQLSFRPLAR